jgi:hypothetical protein
MDEHRLLSSPQLFQIQAFGEKILNGIPYIFKTDQGNAAKIFPSFDFC